MNIDWPRAGNILHIGTDAGMGRCHQTFPIVDRRERPRPRINFVLNEVEHLFTFAGSVGIDLWDMACTDLEILLENHPGGFDTILADGGSESIGGPVTDLSPELVGALDRLAADALILDIALMDSSQLSRLDRLAPKLHGLRIAFLDESESTDIDLSGLPEMPCLRSLSLFGGYNATIRNVSKLESYSGLRHLVVSGLLPTDEVGALEGLDHVEELSLFLHEGTAWPNLGNMTGLKALTGDEAVLGQLKGVTDLERLIVGYVDDPHLEPIGKLTKLRGLQIFPGEVSDKGLANLDKLRSLRAIHLSLPESDADVMKHLGRLKELRTISLFDQSVIADAELAKLTGLQKLERINTLVALEEDGFRHLSKLTGLIELPPIHAFEPGREIFSKLIFPSLLKLRNLERLDLSKTAIEDRDLAKLRRLPKLKTLELNDTKIGDTGASQLAKIRGLTSLGLRASKVSDAAIPQLAKLKHLRRLDLSATQIGDNACTSLAKISSLEELDLSDTKITKVGLDQLLSLPSLRLLQLMDTAVSEDQAELFEKARPSCDVEVAW